MIADRLEEWAVQNGHIMNHDTANRLYRHTFATNSGSGYQTPLIIGETHVSLAAFAS